MNLCKTLLTSAVMGYPIPTLIQYNQTFDNGMSQTFSDNYKRKLTSLEQTS